MKNSKTLEALVGGFVILGILGLAFLAYKVSAVNSIGRQGTYSLYADFNSISGLKEGASVTLAGVKIGQVDSISVDPQSYNATVKLLIDNRYNNLPLDSSLSVLTQGLLGEKYLGIDVGAEVDFFKDGDKFDFTKSAIVLERLVDKFFLKSSTGAIK
ncbi:MAG: outer membrane lipid asymmetry maintenance protein MlaD [Gammaproteobacteria bacterium]|nr:MAG: outer membrane lipid asymmetry maintenance protein MlaD [Gammaproteobacteria bacterium]